MEHIPDFKLQVAAEALKLLPGKQVIGLGAGACVAHLTAMVAGNTELKKSLTLTSSSFKTINLMHDGGLNVKPPAYLDALDIYFDGCDQFDKNLNALKSGGGIHTTEKLVASMAKEFVLLAEHTKRVEELDGTYPLVIELLPPALKVVTKTLKSLFPSAVLTLRQGKDGAIITEYGNFLLEVCLTTFPDLGSLNSTIGMIPGVVGHSLFYQLATKAITAGESGVIIYT